MSNNWVFECTRFMCVLDADILAMSLRDNWINRVCALDYSCNNYKLVHGRQYRKESDLIAYTTLVNRVFNDRDSVLSEFAENITDACEDLINVTSRFAEINWSLEKPQSLMDAWKDFCRVVLPVASSMLLLPGDFIQERIQNVIELLASRLNHKESKHQLLSIINNAVDPVVYREEHLDLLRIGLAIQQFPYLMKLFRQTQNIEKLSNGLPKELKDMIYAHMTQYSWLNLPYATFRKPFQLNDYIWRLHHLVTRSECAKEIDRIQILRERDRERFGQLLKNANSSEETILLNALRDFSYLRTYLATVFDRSLLTIRDTLLKEVGFRLGLTDAQMVSLTIAEISDSISMVSPAVSPAVLDKRADGFAYVFEDGKLTIAFGHQITPFAEVWDQEAHKSVGYPIAVEGMVANEGIAIGSAKILLHPSDNEKVLAGDIIITSMTTPEFISAMEKASAFVTDEGGVNCHAAIHSREFGVPCIVGTEKGTKMFADNDLVRVDAYEGTVQRI